MSRSKESRYYQVPLALLSLVEDPQSFWDLGTSYSAVHAGARRLSAIGRGEWGEMPDANEPWYSEDAFLEWLEDSRPGIVPDDYDRSDWRHRSILCALAPANVQLPGNSDISRSPTGAKPHGGLGYWQNSRWDGSHGSVRFSSLDEAVERYELVCRHVSEMESLTAKRGPYVRIRSDIAADVRCGKIPWDLARIIIAVYSKVGNKPCVALSVREARYRAEGYRSQTAYEEAMRGLGRSPVPHILPHQLEPTPPGFCHERRKRGLLRYDEAIGFLNWTAEGELESLAALGCPLTGDHGVFDVIATLEGILFKVRDAFMPLNGIRTGRSPASRFYRPGQKVLYREYGVQGLFLGVVQAVGETIRVERDGCAVEVRRRDGFITPIDADPELARYVSMAETQRDPIRQEGAGIVTSELCIGTNKARRLLALGARLRFYERVKVTPARWVYSHNKTENELIELLATARAHREREAGRAGRTLSKLEKRLEEKRAAWETDNS